MLLSKFIHKQCKNCGKYFEIKEDFSFIDKCNNCQFPEKNNPQEIVIKPELIDSSKLQINNVKQLWRPETFEQYCGQISLKNILQGYIKGCKELNKTFPHFLISGKAGSGKTAIAYILAKQLNLNFVECVANSLKSPQQLIDKLVEVNGGILFIDELQVISKSIANFILPVMEDFHINGQYIKPFTIFAATTELGILLKKYKPLVDRFKINKVLDNYTIEELQFLLKQYKDKTFFNIKIDDNIYYQIALNCRTTPRIAIRLLESYIFMNQPLNEIFKAYNLVYNGITENDIKILKILNEKESGLGLTSICAYLQTSVENYIYSIESYLIEQGYITIGNKRQITLAGKQFLEHLQ